MTAEQYVNKYLNLTINTTPLSTHNIELAQQAAIELYKVLGLKPLKNLNFRAQIKIHLTK